MLAGKPAYISKNVSDYYTASISSLLYIASYAATLDSD